MANPVELAALEDLPSILDTYYNVFTMESILRVFPATEEGRDYLHDWFGQMIKSEPGHQQSKVYVIKEDGKVVSFAMWYIIRPNDGGCWPWRKRLPALLGRLDEEKCDNFHNPMEDRQMGAFKDAPRLFLQVLGTHEAHRKKGHASALVAMGNTLADELGYACYVDASDAGKSLYESLGYRVIPETTQASPWSMRREKNLPN
ncbi:hypothetical protein GQ53DRAFT_741942 [Thozetella sp. PMI_491]|nr:hypothetical protein GQ53DRAFT_741942 [Thozetella sp. PMI_491]